MGVERRRGAELAGRRVRPADRRRAERHPPGSLPRLDGRGAGPGLQPLPVLVRRAVRRPGGRPPATYLAHVRLHTATELLRDTQLSIAVVAKRVGYESEAAFSRAFKNRYGTPRPIGGGRRTRRPAAARSRRRSDRPAEGSVGLVEDVPAAPIWNPGCHAELSMMSVALCT
ncbi:helix-turn-helix transcriptional regulator [Catenulispora yoronensis]